MSNEKFTPGEWGVFGNRNMLKHYIVLNPQKDVKEQKIIADVFCCGGDVAANAYLIAAAPEMYRNNEQTLTELEQMIPAMLAVCADCNHKKCKVCQFAKVLKTASEMEMRIEQVQKKARGEG